MHLAGRSYQKCQLQRADEYTSSNMTMNKKKIKEIELTKQSFCFGPVQPPAQNRWQHSLGFGPKHLPPWHCGEQKILLNFWQLCSPSPQHPSLQDSWHGGPIDLVGREGGRIWMNEIWMSKILNEIAIFTRAPFKGRLWKNKRCTERAVAQSKQTLTNRLQILSARSSFQCFEESKGVHFSCFMNEFTQWVLLIRMNKEYLFSNTCLV